MKQSTNQNQRYRLHQIIKPHFSYDTKKQLVNLPSNFTANNYPTIVQKALKSLQKLNYSLQTSIQ